MALQLQPLLLLPGRWHPYCPPALFQRPLLPPNACCSIPPLQAFQLIGSPRQGTGQGIILRPGIYSLPIVLTMVRDFTNFGVKAMGGVQRANLQVGCARGRTNRRMHVRGERGPRRRRCSRTRLPTAAAVQFGALSMNGDGLQLDATSGPTRAIR